MATYKGFQLESLCDILWWAFALFPLFSDIPIWKLQWQQNTPLRPFSCMCICKKHWKILKNTGKDWRHCFSFSSWLCQIYLPRLSVAFNAENLTFVSGEIQSSLQMTLLQRMVNLILERLWQEMWKVFCPKYFCTSTCTKAV